MSDLPATPADPDNLSQADWLRPALGVAGVVAILAVWVAIEIRMTSAVRGAVHAYTALLDAANRGDLEAVKALCTESYLRTHPPELAPKGGVAGLPRNIHKNFQAWRQGEAVLLCPSNRVGPVLQFLNTPEGWKFDGIVGLLQAGNVFVPAESGGAGLAGSEHPD